MADFALWATACETALWPPGTFASAYRGNREAAVDNVIEADPVASAVKALVAERQEWSGTASDLLATLGERVTDPMREAKTWPATPRALAGRLRRVATFLRNADIEIEFKRQGRARIRIIEITGRSD